MDSNIDKVREALETLCEALELALARLGVCGQGDGADHKADADSIGGTNALTMGRAALSTLSSIDPEAIRREARAEALREVGEMLEAARDILELYDDDIGMEAFPCATQVKIKSTTLGVLRNFRAAIANAEKDKPEC